MARFDLSDAEWGLIKPLLPNKPRGVARVNDRRVLNGAHLLAQQIDRNLRAAIIEVPKRPAVARVKPLHMRGDAMDRARRIRAHERAIGAHLRAVTSAEPRQNHARLQQSALDQRAERNPRLRFLRARNGIRGSDFFERVTATASSPAGSTASIRRRATRM